MNNNVNFYIILMSNVNNNTILNTSHGTFETTPKLPHQVSTTSHFAIWLIIFSATMILLVLISLMICTICCKYYRRRENGFFGRSSSFASIQELIRARLQDRPPTYHESQSSLATAQSDEPPTYQEIVETGVVAEPTIFVVSSKRIIFNESNDDSPTFVEEDSDSDAPPSYYSFEGVVQERNNNHTTADNRNVMELDRYRTLDIGIRQSTLLYIHIGIACLTVTVYFGFKKILRLAVHANNKIYLPRSVDRVLHKQ